jgi:hypothetical protein
VIEVRRHNAAFCQECFVHHVHETVKRTVKSHRMFGPDERIMVAVSGGKDSLGLWDVLLDLGYDVTGMYLGLGIGDYSDRSREITEQFAEERGAELIDVDLRGEYGYDIPTAGKKACRSGTCSTAWRSTTGSTWSRPATTSTTRRRRCSGTRCGGRPATSPGSSRCCPSARAW